MGKEILKIFNKISSFIGAIYTMLTAIFGIEGLLFWGYLVLNVLDYITGTIKAKIKHTESSSKGVIGIVKKHAIGY